MAMTIDSIKNEFEKLIGEDIVIIVEAGRRRTTTHKGKLTETYPSVFIVELNDSEDSYERVSFSYADVLTETIEVDFPNQETTILVEE